MNDVQAMDRPLTGAKPDTKVINGLSVVSIAKSYDKRSVLSDVSLSVGRGEVVGLLGPNGAGKTTCFYSIMGLVKPDSGRIELFECSLRHTCGRADPDGAEPSQC